MAHKSSVELQGLGNIEDLESAAKQAKSHYEAVIDERDEWLGLEATMESTLDGEPANSEWYDSMRATHSKSSKRKIDARSPRASKRIKGS